MIFVAFFHVFRVNNLEKCPRGGVLARFIGPGGGSLNSFLPGGGEFAHQKIARGDGQAWN